MEVTLTGCTGVGKRGREKEELLICVPPSLQHFCCSIYLTPVFNLNLQPQSSVQTAINGHPVTMATPRHRAVGAHSGVSLSFLSFPSPSVCLFSFNMGSLCFSLCVICPNTDRTISLCFFTPLFPRGLVSPSLYRSLFCPLYVSSCLSLCLSTNNPTRVVKSWQSHLSCRGPRR